MSACTPLHVSVPCKRCPWKRETPPGEFPASRYEELRVTSEQPDGHEPGIGAPMFACHKTAEGRERACAGWLALFDSYQEMAAHQAGDEQ